MTSDEPRALIVFHNGRVAGLGEDGWPIEPDDAPGLGEQSALGVPIIDLDPVSVVDQETGEPSQ